MRALLEVPAAKLAALRRSDEHLERLRAAIPGQPLRLGTQEQFVHNADFHSTVIDASCNTLLSMPEPVFAVLQTRLALAARPEVSPVGQRPPSRDRGGHRVRRGAHRRAAHARAPRLPAAVLRAGMEGRGRPIPMTGVAFGIQGSGQHVNGAPDPGVFRELAQQRRGARLRLDLGRRSHLLPQPDPRRRRRAVDVRRRPGGSRSAPPSCCRCGIRVSWRRSSRPRLRVRRTGDPRRGRRRRGREGLRGSRRAGARARLADE